uniref:Putative secreted protein n=1 Tax=Ixodes ricinus TaxID=34613 RepID=A0A6B0V5I3_IXORI
MSTCGVLWFTFKLLFVASAVYGAAEEMTIEDFVDEIIDSAYFNIEKYIPDNKPVMFKSEEIFLDNSPTPTVIKTFSLGTISSLGTSFIRTGKCSVRTTRGKITINCKVEFQGVQATLPKTTEDGSRCILFIYATGNLFLSWPQDNRPVKVKLITLPNVTFAMSVTGLEKGASTTTPSSYSLDENSPTNFTKIYRLLFQKLITEGAFKTALDTTFEHAQKPQSIIFEKTDRIRQKTK